MLLTAQRLLTGRELLRPGWIEVSGTKVLALGTGAPPRAADRALDTVVPGFVDTHVHGGGGSDFSAATRADTVAAVDLHRRHGTTTLVASLVSAGAADLLHQVEVLAGHAHDGLIAGVHLEGPWLSVQRCGAHDPVLLRDPDPGELDEALTAGDGTIRMVTLAPERRGGIAAIERIVSAGAVAAVGHTEATYEQTRAAIAAGATVGTHLFNAMRPIHHREPGPVIALMEDTRVTVEMIADGVHVDGAVYRHVTRAVGPDRLSLITDAMAATGASDGRYQIGRMDVEVAGGVANLAGTATIAGSTATMDRVFRFAVAHSGLPPDEALAVAVLQSSMNPARALALPSPELTAGGCADLVALDADLMVTDVLHNGAWVPR
ncbi:N-acetylglucosamine-6-phosphate deacetylase [Mycolicibacterium rhodesiae JS60]|nr:N-acetylglucosamine-6-phosphate deacetylase [Mycolicibacterium rhodesiae JS60]